MSSRNAEAAPGDPLGNPRARGSITRLLAGLYIGSTAILLAIVVGWLAWAISNDLEDEARLFLEDNIHVLRAVLRDRPDDESALRDQMKWEETARRFTSFYARILDENDAVLMQTKGMDEVAPALAPFPRPLEVDEPSGHTARWRGGDGSSLLLESAWADVGRVGHRRVRLQLAMDVGRRDALVAGWRGQLALVLVAGILVSAGLAVGAARRGLRPLRQIAAVARSVHAAELHTRIDAARWPRELSDLATAFDEMLDRLDLSFARLSQFSADLAHELRTPINNLMGEAEVALSRLRSPEAYQHVLQSCLEECGRLSRMIESLLFLARAENPETRIERTLVEARQEIAAVLEYYEAIAEEREIQVVVEGQATLATDPVLFRRAVSNLISNAIHYTSKGGKVTVTVVPQSDGGTHLVVSDTGIGVEARHLPRLFDRFYRADGARSQHPQGTGLGLAIVKSIMQMHRGTVQIESKLGVSTTVTLRFRAPERDDAAA